MSAPVLERPRPVYRAADLLGAYLPGSFYFSSPRGVLLADGVHASVRTQRDTSCAGAVADVLDNAAASGVVDPIVVGAKGFRPDSETSLVVPSVVRRAEAAGDSGVPTGPGAPAGSRPDGGGAWTVTPRPSPEAYTDEVRQALAMIDRGDVSKIVLARCIELTAGDPVAVPSLLDRLARDDPAAHAFAIDVTAPGDPAARTLVGASPEMLLARRGESVVSAPLAGSSPRSSDGAEDQRRFEALLASEKDRREHAHVVEQVSEVLGRFCVDLAVSSEPHIVGTPTMWHLGSRITGRLHDPSDPASSSLALAEALHPTPAVCGVPGPRANSAIARLEPEDRGYYAGLAGWTAPGGDGEWVVTIRSAEVSERTVRLFAGAGIVAGSDPEAELEETTAKLRTQLRALGLEERHELR